MSIEIVLIGSFEKEVTKGLKPAIGWEESRKSTSANLGH